MLEQVSNKNRALERRVVPPKCSVVAAQFKEAMNTPQGKDDAVAQSELNAGLGVNRDIVDRLRDSQPTGTSGGLLLNDAADEIQRLRVVFRVNILRIAPETLHAEIDRVLFNELRH